MNTTEHCVEVRKKDKKSNYLVHRTAWVCAYRSGNR